MNKLYIEIFLKKFYKSDHKNDGDDYDIEIFLTPESFIILFIYNYLNSPKNIELNYIQNNNLNEEDEHHHLNKCVRLKDFDSKLSSLLLSKSIENENSQQYHHLPMYQKEDNFFIFGICAICRAIVLESGKHDHLLGFKKNCLLAPTEKSIWTKLCEIDMITAIKDVIQKISQQKNYDINDTDDDHHVILSEYFTVFENHMSQPTRIHNYYKILREVNENVSKLLKQQQGSSSSISIKFDDANYENNSTTNSHQQQQNDGNNHESSSSSTLNSILEHRYAEGYYISLVDIILYPFIAFLYLIMMNDKMNFINSFPLIYKWMINLEEYDKELNENFHKILNTDYYQNQLLSEKMNNSRISRKLNFMKNECNEMKMNSLYRNDIRTIRLDKEYTNQDKIDECLKKISNLQMKIKSINTEPNQLKYFDWNLIEETDLIRPEFGNLPKDRIERKKHQLKNLINYVIEISKPNDVIVDFCSGTGHLGIILAKFLKNCHIIFLENKSISIMKTKERIDKLKLNNCSFYQCNIDYFHRKFDIGVSLHACGTATDIVIQKCLRFNANFVCCPCCYGSIKPMPHISYPLSKIFIDCMNENDYMYIAHAADQSHNVTVKNCNLNKREQGEFCMDCIDTDRKFLAEQYDYDVQLKRLYPEDCTPKNRLLIGIKNYDDL